MAGKTALVADLGLGNLRSVLRALERAGLQAELTTDPDALLRASALVVPGQGAFRDCARALERGFGEAIRTFIASGKPYLGLCLGMQVLFARSEEAEGAKGLGIFPGGVKRFARDHADPSTQERLKVPHMGWNDVRGRHPLLPEQGWFYFVHSYYCEPEDAQIVAATAHYGVEFCCAVARDNVFACQFHPEKSQDEGRLFLERFVRGL